MKEVTYKDTTYPSIANRETLRRIRLRCNLRRISDEILQEMADDALFDFLHMEIVSRLTNTDSLQDAVKFKFKYLFLFFVIKSYFCRMKLCRNWNTSVTLRAIVS